MIGRESARSAISASPSHAAVASAQIVRKRIRRLEDNAVDHALVVLPGAEAVLVRGDLITKGQAMDRLGEFGVTTALAQEIRNRRAGHEVTQRSPEAAARVPRPADHAAFRAEIEPTLGADRGPPGTATVHVKLP